MTEQVIKSVSQIKQVNTLQSIICVTQSLAIFMGTDLLGSHHAMPSPTVLFHLPRPFDLGNVP